VAAMLGDPPKNRGNLKQSAYLTGKQERNTTCKAH
jgi:hypothetical protein